MGRPRKYISTAARVAAHRATKRDVGRRVEVFLTNSASWRLTSLAAAWGMSKSDAMNRLILEADDRYRADLFPETE